MEIYGKCLLQEKGLKIGNVPYHNNLRNKEHGKILGGGYHATTQYFSMVKAMIMVDQHIEMLEIRDNPNLYPNELKDMIWYYSKEDKPYAFDEDHFKLIPYNS